MTLYDILYFFDRLGEERLRHEYQRLVEGLRRAREERENDIQLANPGNKLHYIIYTVTHCTIFIHIILYMIYCMAGNICKSNIVCEILPFL